MDPDSPGRDRPARPAATTRPSVCIRRLPFSNSSLTPPEPLGTDANTVSQREPNPATCVRPNSPSFGQPPSRPPAPRNLSTLAEGDDLPRIALNITTTNEPDTFQAAQSSNLDPLSGSITARDFEPGTPEPSNLRVGPSKSRLGFGRRSNNNDVQTKTQTRSRAGSKASQSEYDSDLVNLLDVIDPQISTLSTLTNLQNSLFIPDLGPLLNRRATYNLSRTATTIAPRTTSLGASQSPADKLQEEVDSSAEQAALKRLSHSHSITSTLSQSRYAVLPHGVSLDGWSEVEKEELNDYVRHLLHSRRAAFKRGMKGFGQYVRKPLGLFVTIYATLITLFGLAWVLFLIGWINVGSKKLYIINVIDNVLVALFAIMGDGLAPFRAVDTYHMIFIAHYTRLTWRLRKQQQLPKLANHNDLPTCEHSRQLGQTDDDVEAAPSALPKSESAIFRNSEVVLSPKQQKKLEHHQAKFSKSHTFYKPHETGTHYAFPVKLLIAIVIILDCHSLLQIALGTCTWAINYKVRPFVLTTVILCCSITCNITGGILISIGDHRTRKKEVRERMFRQQLTEDAMGKMEKRRQRELDRDHELESHVDVDAITKGDA